MENIVFYSYLALFPLFMILGILFDFKYRRRLWIELTQKHGIFLPARIGESPLLTYLHKEEQAPIKAYIRQHPDLLELYRRAHWGVTIFIGGFILWLIGLPFLALIIQLIFPKPEASVNNLGDTLLAVTMLGALLITPIPIIITSTITSNQFLYRYRKYQQKEGIDVANRTYRLPTTSEGKARLKADTTRDPSLNHAYKRYKRAETLGVILLFTFLILIASIAIYLNKVG